jgi:hypothetical protein
VQLPQVRWLLDVIAQANRSVLVQLEMLKGGSQGPFMMSPPAQLLMERSGNRLAFAMQRNLQTLSF